MTGGGWGFSSKAPGENPVKNTKKKPQLKKSCTILISLFFLRTSVAVRPDETVRTATVAKEGARNAFRMRTWRCRPSVPPVCHAQAPAFRRTLRHNIAGPRMSRVTAFHVYACRLPCSGHNKNFNKGKPLYSHQGVLLQAHLPTFPVPLQTKEE